MPRDGSPTLPSGAVPPAPIIGEAANPPFAVLPDPGALFMRRSRRFAALAPSHELEHYLEFLARLTAAQHQVQRSLDAAPLPSAEQLRRASDNTMPPLSIGQVELGAEADRAFAGIASLLLADDLTAASRAAAEKVLALVPEARAAMMRAVLHDEIPADRIAEHVIAAAAVQVHFARLASRLHAASLKRVADGACPVCGSAPVASAVVGWDGANGTRFCTCSICATQWHVIRIRCLVCGSDEGVAYHSLEGGAQHIFGETCEKCSSYVKIFHQHKDPALDPVADDVASLALDVVLGREGWMRGAINPFLMGY